MEFRLWRNPLLLKLLICINVWSIYLLCLKKVTLTWDTYQRHYLIVNHIGAVRAEHDDFTIRFASAMNQVMPPALHRKSSPWNLIRIVSCHLKPAWVCYLTLFLQLLLLKSTDGSDVDWSKEVKGNMYDMIVEGFQLLSRWTARIWEQCAWKFSRPCKDASPSFSDYEKVRNDQIF